MVVHLRGALGHRSEHLLRRAIENALLIGGVEYLILDMAEVGHVDSAGIDVLLIAKDLAEASGATLVLANTTNYVLQMYKIAHFGRVTSKPDGKELMH